MGARPARIVKGSLTRKGFVEDDTHHHYFWMWVNGRKTGIFTYYSQGAKECDDFLLGQMARQLKLSRRQFDQLIDCSLREDDYVRLLRETGVL